MLLCVCVCTYILCKFVSTLFLEGLQENCSKSCLWREELETGNQRWQGVLCDLCTVNFTPYRYTFFKKKKKKKKKERHRFLSHRPIE